MKTKNFHFHLRVVDRRSSRGRRDRDNIRLHQLLVKGPLLRDNRASRVNAFTGARLGSRGLGSRAIVDADARERVRPESDAAVATADARPGGSFRTEPVPGALLVEREARVVPLGGSSGAHGDGTAGVTEQRGRARARARGAKVGPLQALDLLGGVDAGTRVLGGLDRSRAVGDRAGGLASVSPKIWKPAARVPSLRRAEQSAVRPVVVSPNSLKASAERPPAKEAQAASQVTPEGAAWKLAPRRSAAEAVREGSVC